MFHAELDAPSSDAGHATGHADPSEYSTFLQSRPQQWEISALQLILRIARSYPDLRFHIVHLSASDAIPILQSALGTGKGKGKDTGAGTGKDTGKDTDTENSTLENLTVETCFHYLCLCDTDIPPNGTQFKCCPPIRDESNRVKLIEALVDGTIHYVVSDHSPCVPELKKGDFMSAWGGVSGLGLGLSLLWTELGAGGRVELGRIVEWMGPVQARQVGLQGKKGVIQTGAAADFVVFDPDATFEVTLVSVCFALVTLSRCTLVTLLMAHRRRCGSRTRCRRTSGSGSRGGWRRRTSGARWCGSTGRGRGTPRGGGLCRRMYMYNVRS